MSTYGFIGSGRVAAFMLEGWRRAGKSPTVTASDVNAAAADALAARFPFAKSVKADVRAAAGCDVVFLAVHPPVMKDALAAINGAIQQDAVVVSLAPKVQCTAISSALGTKHVCRAIPNAPSVVNKGFNPVSFGEGFPQGMKRAVLDIFAPLGASPEVPEKDLEAYAIVSAMGPTYFWFQMYELVRLGESFGLTMDAARNAVASMMEGGVAAFSSGLSPEAVMDLVPVKPIGEDEGTIKAIYAAKLDGLYKKLKGQ